MKKLTLDLNALEVQSFATEPATPNRGTVRAEQCTCPTACTCPGCPTCDETCPDTCYETCAAGFTCATCGGQETCGYTCWTRRCPCYYSDPC
jgi:hypothetical protein